MFRSVILNLLLFSCVFSASHKQFSADDILKVYSPYKIEEQKIVLDGVLNENQWENAPVIVDFIQLDPSFNSNPSQNSEVKIIYDNDNIYFGVTLYDSPKNISYKNGEYDDFESIFFENSDYFIIEIDSHYDRNNSYGFAINASNVQSDYTIYDNEFFDDNWDGVWYSEISGSNQSWVIECKMPINNLRFDNESNLSMGINFMRYIKRNDEYISWALLPYNESDEIVSHYGEINNLNFDVKKYFSVRTNIYSQKINYDDHFYYTVLDDDGNIDGIDFASLIPFHEQVYNNNIGLNFKYMIDSNTTFDLLINPEYTNIEQDQSEINNSAYETYFDEKRPFFIEQSQIFSSPIEIFYSRRIGSENFYFPYAIDENITYIELESDIDLSFKLASKNKNGLSYGIIGAQSSVSNNMLFQNDNKAYHSIFRVQKQILNNNSYVGFLNTNFNLRDLNSNVYAIDGLFDITDYGLDFSYQIATSVVGNEKGLGGTFEIDFKSLPLTFSSNENTVIIDAWLRYDKYDKKFNIDYSGYLFRNDLKSYNCGISFNFINGQYFASSIISLKSIESYNLNEVLLDDLLSIDWNAELNNNWMLGLGISNSNYAYIDKLYDVYFYSIYAFQNIEQINIKKPEQDNFYFSINTDTRKKISIKTVYNYFNNSINDDGAWSIISSKFKVSKYLDIELIVDDLSYYKKYQFLKIKKVNLPNGFFDSDDMIANYPRSENWHFFTSSDIEQKSYMLRFTSYINNGLSIKLYAEYFKYSNSWDDNTVYYIKDNASDFSYPDEYPSTFPPISEEDVLLYFAKFSSLSINFSINWQINKNYSLLAGYQYNKNINGYDYDNINDVIDFNINENNVAEIFYDDTFFIKCEMLLGNSF